MVDLVFLFRHSVSDASYEMLLAPMLALFTVTLNFYALFHIVSEWNGLSTGGWRALDRAIHALEETTVVAYENYRGMAVPPTSVPSPIYFSPIRRAEWVYRSSAIRVLDLVDGSSKVQKAQSAASSPLLPPSPTRPMYPVIPANILPPSLTSPAHPATFGSFPTLDHPTPLAPTFSVALSLGRAWFISCSISMLILICLKVSLSTPPAMALLSTPQYSCHRNPAYATKPTLTCDVHRQILGENFHSIYTATSIPSYPGMAVDPSQLELDGPSSNLRTPHVELPTALRTFPVVFTNSDGTLLFEAEVKFSSNHVPTELLGITSPVSLTGIVAPLHIPSGEPLCACFTPKELTPHQYPIWTFSPSSELQKSVHTSRVQIAKLRIPPQVVGRRHCSLVISLLTWCIDISPLGSPMCPVTIPIHHRGFSAFVCQLYIIGVLFH